MPGEKPKAFVGSSAEGLIVAYEVQTALEYDVECTVWPQGVFGPTRYPLEDLEKALDQYQYGIFVLTPDDRVWLRNEEYAAARDNVIAELFLFIGRYGRDH